MKFSISVDTDRIFKPEVAPTIDAYLSRKINAKNAAAILGWDRSTWERHMAGVFSEGNSTIEEAQP